MAFLKEGITAFINQPVEQKRSDHRLKTVGSCEDTRAWVLDQELNRQHFLNVVNSVGSGRGGAEGEEGGRAEAGPSSRLPQEGPFQLEDKIKELEEEKDFLKNVIADKENEIERLLYRINGMAGVDIAGVGSDDVALLQDQFNDLVKKYDEKNNELNNTKNRLDKAEQMVNNLHEIMESTGDDPAKHKDVLDNVMKSLKPDMRDGIDNFQDQMKTLEDKLKNAYDEIDSLKQDLEFANGQIDALASGDSGELNRIISGLRNELDNTKKLKDAENKALKDIIDNKDIELKRLKDILNDDEKKRYIPSDKNNIPGKSDDFPTFLTDPKDDEVGPKLVESIMEKDPNELSDLKNKINELEKMLSDEKELNNKLKEDLQNEKDKFNKLASADDNELKKMLADAERLNNKLMIENEKDKDLINSLNSEIDRNKNIPSGVREVDAQLPKEQGPSDDEKIPTKPDFTSELDRIGKENMQLKKENQDLKKQIEDLGQSMIPTSTTAKQPYSVLARDEDKGANELRDEIKKLLHENKDLKDELKNLKGKGIKDQTEGKEPIKETVSKEKETLPEDISIAELLDKNKQLLTENEGLRKENDALKKALADMENESNKTLKQSPEALKGKDNKEGNISTDINELKQENDRLNKALKDENDRKKKLQDKIDGLESENNDLKSKLDGDEGKLKLTKSDKDNLKPDQVRDTAKPTQDPKELDELVDKVKELENANKKLKELAKDEKDKLNESLANKDKTIANLENQLKQLKKENEDQQKNAPDLKQGKSKPLVGTDSEHHDVVKCEEEKAKLKAENEKLKERLKEPSAKEKEEPSTSPENKKLVDENEKLKKELENIKKQPESSKKLQGGEKEVAKDDEDVKKLNDENKILKEKIKTLEGQLKDDSPIAQDISTDKKETQDIPKLLNEIQSLKGENEKLRKDNDGLKKELKEAKAIEKTQPEKDLKDSSNVDEENKKLKQKLNLLEDELKSLKSDVPKKDEKVAESKSLKSDVPKKDEKVAESKITKFDMPEKTKVENIESIDNNKLKAENARLVKENDSLKQQIDKLTGKPGITAQDVKDTKDDKSLQDKLNALEKDNNELKSKNDSLNKSLRDAEHAKQELEKDNNKLSDLLSKAEEGGLDENEILNMYKDKADKLKSENGKLEQKVIELESQLDKLKNENNKLKDATDLKKPIQKPPKEDKQATSSKEALGKALPDKGGPPRPQSVPEKVKETADFKETTVKSLPEKGEQQRPQSAPQQLKDASGKTIPDKKVQPKTQLQEAQPTPIYPKKKKTQEDEGPIYVPPVTAPAKAKKKSFQPIVREIESSDIPQLDDQKPQLATKPSSKAQAASGKEKIPKEVVDSDKPNMAKKEMFVREVAQAKTKPERLEQAISERFTDETVQGKAGEKPDKGVKDRSGTVPFQKTSKTDQLKKPETPRKADDKTISPRPIKDPLSPSSELKQGITPDTREKLKFPDKGGLDEMRPKAKMEEDSRKKQREPSPAKREKIGEDKFEEVDNKKQRKPSPAKREKTDGGKMEEFEDIKQRKPSPAKREKTDGGKMEEVEDKKQRKPSPKKRAKIYDEKMEEVGDQKQIKPSPAKRGKTDEDKIEKEKKPSKSYKDAMKDEDDKWIEQKKPFLKESKTDKVERERKKQDLGEDRIKGKSIQETRSKSLDTYLKSKGEKGLTEPEKAAKHGEIDKSKKKKDMVPEMKSWLAGDIDGQDLIDLDKVSKGYGDKDYDNELNRLKKQLNEAEKLIDSLKAENSTLRAVNEEMKNMQALKEGKKSLTKFEDSKRYQDGATSKLNRILQKAIRNGLKSLYLEELEYVHDSLNDSMAERQGRPPTPGRTTVEELQNTIGIMEQRMMSLVRRLDNYRKHSNEQQKKLMDYSETVQRLKTSVGLLEMKVDSLQYETKQLRDLVSYEKEKSKKLEDMLKSVLSSCKCTKKFVLKQNYPGLQNREVKF